MTDDDGNVFSDTVITVGIIPIFSTFIGLTSYKFIGELQLVAAMIFFIKIKAIISSPLLSK